MCARPGIHVPWVPQGVNPGKSQEACPSSSGIYSVEVALVSHVSTFPVFPYVATIAPEWLNRAKFGDCTRVLSTLYSKSQTLTLNLPGRTFLVRSEALSSTEFQIYGYSLEKSIAIPSLFFISLGPIKSQPYILIVIVRCTQSFYLLQFKHSMWFHM